METIDCSMMMHFYIIRTFIGLYYSILNVQFCIFVSQCCLHFSFIYNIDKTVYLISLPYQIEISFKVMLANLRVDFQGKFVMVWDLGNFVNLKIWDHHSITWSYMVLHNTQNIFFSTRNMHSLVVYLSYSDVPKLVISSFSDVTYCSSNMCLTT